MAAKLTGKVALITGGNSGMGLASAKLLAEQGAQVVITGRRQKEVDEAAKAIGHNALGIQGDVASLPDLDAGADLEEIFLRATEGPGSGPEPLEPRSPSE